MYLCVRESVPSLDSQMSCICALGVSSQDNEMSCICVLGPDLVLISLTHKYMTSHCPDLVPILVYLYQVRTVRWHVFVC
jgi:hypothetical protein